MPRRRDYGRFICCLIVLITCLQPVASRAATVEEIDQALRQAKQFIYAQQNKEGTWDRFSAPQHTGEPSAVGGTDEAQWGGLTAICTYALIVAGESPVDPRLARAITFLKNARFYGTYALAMRCQVWTVLPQDADTRSRARADATALMNGLITTGRGRGFYNYSASNSGFDVPQRWFDLSNGQMGVLGVWAADQACYPNGAQIPVAYWQTVDQAWRAMQLPSGGWEYTPVGRLDQANERLSMTAAGVATLFVTQDYLHRDAGLICQDRYTDKVLEAGMDELATQFPTLLKQSILADDPIRACYALYGFERIGAASGRRYLKGLDWYAKGADYLIDGQNRDGSCGGMDRLRPTAGDPTGFPHNPWGLPDTCFLMIFLSRGRAPIAVSKLEYGQPGTWDQRSRDAANLTRWLSYQTEKFLNWQAIGLADPIDDFHDSAMLYVAGSGPLDFTDAETAKLNQYIEEGGLLVGNADCGSTVFSNSFVQLAQKMFPSYQFRPLGPGTLIQSGELFKPKPGRETIGLSGLSNGVRELMLLIPSADSAKYWQSQQVVQRPEQFQVMGNILLYATDRLNGLRVRGQRPFPRPDANAMPAGKLSVARLQFRGNWDAEPAGWRRMAALLHNDGTADLDVQTVDLAHARIDPVIDLAVMTGIGSFALSDAERKVITEYINYGGTLVIDAAGGDGPFATSAEKELAAIFPGVDPSPPAWDDVPVGYRKFARSVVGESKSARLRGYNVNGRMAVYYSPDDLSAGLVGEEIDGIRGYDPQTATALMRKIITSVQAIRRQANGQLPAPPDSSRTFGQ